MFQLEADTLFAISLLSLLCPPALGAYLTILTLAEFICVSISNKIPYFSCMETMYSYLIHVSYRIHDLSFTFGLGTDITEYLYQV